MEVGAPTLSVPGSATGSSPNRRHVHLDCRCHSSDSSVPTIGELRGEDVEAWTKINLYLLLTHSEMLMVIIEGDRLARSDGYAIDEQMVMASAGRRIACRSNAVAFNAQAHCHPARHVGIIRRRNEKTRGCGVMVKVACPQPVRPRRATPIKGRRVMVPSGMLALHTIGHET
jgi:hypothetical protein